MRIRNKKIAHKKVLLIVTVAIAVLLIAGSLVYAFVFKGDFFGLIPKSQEDNTVNGIDYGPPTEEEKDTGTNIKENNTSPETKPGEAETPPDTSSQNVAVSIPYSEQTGTSLRVTTLIEKLTSSGICTLTLSRSGYESVVATAEVQAQASSATCKGFTISTSGLAAGTWNLRIDYKDGNNTGSASKEQTIR